MSTNLVVPAQKKGKELISQAQAEDWLEKVSDGKELFVSVIPGSIRRPLTNSFAVGTIAFLGTSLIDLIPAIFIRALSGWTPLDEPQQAMFLGLVLSPGLAVAAVSSLIASKGDKRRAAVWTAISEFEKQGLSAWLKARYGLTVSDGTLKDITEKVLFNEPSEFSDDRGKTWNLRNAVPDGSENVSWFVEEEQPAAVEEFVALEVSIAQVTLPSEAKTLHDSIQNRLDTLKAYSLSIESSHNVSRSEQETQQAILSYRKLEALGEEVSGYVELIEVLSAVNEDLLAVIKREAKDVKTQLAVQGQYLRMRQVDSGSTLSSGLQIPAALNMAEEPSVKSER